MKLAVSLMALGVFTAEAQGLKVPESFSKLADKADEVVNVQLDPSTLGMAAKFLSDKDPDEAAAKKLVTGLRGIEVHSYKFLNEGEYSESDVAAVRSQMRGPEWSCIVTVRNKREHSNADVCFLKAANGSFSGLAILATEPKELTIVNISGSIDPEQLRLLDGQFGVPKLDLDRDRRKTEKPKADKPAK